MSTLYEYSALIINIELYCGADGYGNPDLRLPEKDRGY